MDCGVAHGQISAQEEDWLQRPRSEGRGGPGGEQEKSAGAHPIGSGSPKLRVGLQGQREVFGKGVVCSDSGLCSEKHASADRVGWGLVGRVGCTQAARKSGRGWLWAGRHGQGAIWLAGSLSRLDMQKKTLFLSGLQGQSFSTNAGLLFSMVDHPRPLFFLRPSTQPI